MEQFIRTEAPPAISRLSPQTGSSISNTSGQARTGSRPLPESTPKGMILSSTLSSIRESTTRLPNS